MRSKEAGQVNKVDNKEVLGSGLPEHIAIIPDGNRRWARDMGFPVSEGYMEGAKRISEVVDEAIVQGVHHLTFWVVSPDNIAKRDPEELATWYKAINKHVLDSSMPTFIERGVLVRTIGDLDRENLPGDFVDKLEKFKKLSLDNLGTTLTFAVNYGGREDVDNAFVHARNTGSSINSLADLREHLESSREGLPDPEWVIRTGGESRLSTFMPLQTMSSDYDFPHFKWPDFTRHQFRESLKRFAGTKKTHGA